MSRHAAPEGTSPSVKSSQLRPRHAESPFTMSVLHAAWLSLAILAAAFVNLLAPVVIR